MAYFSSAISTAQGAAERWATGHRGPNPKRLLISLNVVSGGPSSLTWLGLAYLSHLLPCMVYAEERRQSSGLELGGPKWAGQGLQPSPARKCFQMLPTSARHTRARSTHMMHITRSFLYAQRRHASDIKAERRATKQIVGNLERSGLWGGGILKHEVLHTFYSAVERPWTWTSRDCHFSGPWTRRRVWSASIRHAPGVCVWCGPRESKAQVKTNCSVVLTGSAN